MAVFTIHITLAEAADKDFDALVSAMDQDALLKGDFVRRGESLEYRIERNIPIHELMQVVMARVRKTGRQFTLTVMKSKETARQKMAAER